MWSTLSCAPASNFSASAAWRFDVVFVVVQGTVSQNLFTEAAYTDTLGAQSWLTADAAVYTTEGGYTFWKWDAGANGTFNNGTGYTINFS